MSIVYCSTAIATDSSLYDVVKINANEFWAGGENGVLKSIDSFGNAKNIIYPNLGLHIYKILSNTNTIYLFANNGTIYCYNIAFKTWNIKTFAKYKNKCFYDAVFLANGKIAICGGASGIAKAKKQIPRGFIFIVDDKLTKVEKDWHYWRKFIWHLAVNNKQELYATFYNGFNSRISFLQKNKFQKKYRVGGLVHHIASNNDTIIYSGFKKNKNFTQGYYGMQSKNNNWQNNVSSASIWTAQNFNDGIIFTSANTVYYSKNNKQIQFALPAALPIYEAAIINQNKFIVVGSGGQYAIMQLLP